MGQKNDKKTLSQDTIMKVLDFAYEKAVNGLPGLDSAAEIAETYMNNGKDEISNCNELIRWQISRAGVSGFLTGLGGVLALPVTLPANIASVMYIQVRMIAAIAHMGGEDLRDDKVKSLVFLCLAGNAAIDVLKDIGIEIGGKIAKSMIQKVSGETIKAINQKIGFRLLTKFGEKGVINLGKAIPLLGGVIGGTIDGATTNAIGNFARKVFIESPSELPNVATIEDTNIATNGQVAVDLP